MTAPAAAALAAVLLPSWATLDAWLHLDLLVKLVLAVALGGVVGLEREFSGHPAGLRTNILICLGATLLMHLSLRVGLVDGVHVGDPGRIAAQVVSGIGFLGAGAILHTRGIIRGLTTAATIWVVAAVGLAIGAGGFVEATGAVLLVGIVLTGLRYVERRLHGIYRAARIVVRMADDAPPALVDHALEDAGLRMRNRQVIHRRTHRTVRVTVTASPERIDAVCRALMQSPGVQGVQVD